MARRDAAQRKTTFHGSRWKAASRNNRTPQILCSLPLSRPPIPKPKHRLPVSSSVRSATCCPSCRPTCRSAVVSRNHTTLPWSRRVTPQSSTSDSSFAPYTCTSSTVAACIWLASNRPFVFRGPYFRVAIEFLLASGQSGARRSGAKGLSHTSPNLVSVGSESL